MRAETKIYKKLSVLPLASVIFLTVSGGPYGLEPVLYYVGGGGALLLLVITPILWDIPTILTVMELNSMMPITGGYYQWVKRAMGMRWACYEGWWTWLYTFVDLAIYPQLFILYASLFFPQIAAYRIPICLCFIWICAGINILGIVPVGKISMLLGALVLIPFIVLIAVSNHPAPHLTHFAASFKNTGSSLIGMGLFTIMWNFIGWDNVTTYAEEVKSPVKSYRKAVVIAFCTVFVLYFATVLTTEQSHISPTLLRDNGFAAIGPFTGRNWLGLLISAGGMISSIGLFSAVLLSVSRVPQVMSEDKLLPGKLHALHPKYGSPHVSIIICAIVVSCMTAWTFGELLIIDITIYFAGLALEYISLVKLRIKEPNATRPFKIRLNTTGLCIMVALPIIVYLTALSDAIIKSKEAVKPALFAFALILSAEVMWIIVKWKNPRIADIKEGENAANPKY